MCGIGGVWFSKKIDAALLTSLVLESESRGSDAFGATLFLSPTYAGEREDFTIRLAMPAHKALQTELWSTFVSKLSPGSLVIFNTRAQPLTESVSSSVETIQPVESQRYIAVHNGVVSNEIEITESEKLERKSLIDSEVIPLLVERYGVSEAFKRLSGGFAVALVEKSPLRLHLIKDFKTLAVAVDGRTETFAFASEMRFLKKALGGETGLFSPVKFENLPPYTDTMFFNFGCPTAGEQVELKTRAVSSLPVATSKAVVCASGGIDSTTAAYVAKKIHGCESVMLVHFDHGQKSEKCEWNAVRRIARELGARAELVNLSWLGALGNSVLTDPDLPVPHAEPKNIKSTCCWTPARNLTMMSALASIAESEGASSIYAGWSLEEEGAYPDNSIDFFRTFNECLDYGTIARPKVKLPLAHLMKKETVLLGKYLGVPYELTWSCDGGDLRGHCGRCGACFLHHYSFLLAGLPDPTKYAEPLAFPFKPPWERPDFQATEVPIESILRKMT